MLIERKRRTATKALSWRILATLTTVTIVFVITGELGLTVAVGGFDVVLKMILYYFHERGWNRIRWGKRKVSPFVLWMTGLPGSGKSTLAKAVSDELSKLEISLEQLDGDKIRKLFPKTGYTKDERNMHIRRIGFLASLLEKNGIFVVCSFISPYKESREFVRSQTNNFVEIYLDAPQNVCEKRDPKGLYKKVRAGELAHFTGVDDPYEKPENPEIVLDTANQDVETCKQKVIEYLKKVNFIV